MWNFIGSVSWGFPTYVLKQKLRGSRAYKVVSAEEHSVDNDHCSRLPLKSSVTVKDRQDKLPTINWLPEIHKKHNKARLIPESR